MRLLVGTYTRARGGIPAVKGQGIVFVEVDPQKRSWRFAAEPLALEDPSYMAWSADKRHLLAVAEGGAAPNFLQSLQVLGSGGSSVAGVSGGNGSSRGTGSGGTVGAASATASASSNAGGALLKPVGIAETHGRASCHVVALPGGKRFAVASYLDACLDTFVMDESGELRPESHYKYEGSSTHPRQKNSHAHQVCVAPGGDFLFVCDLGSDSIWQHPVDPQTGEVGPVSARITVPAGQGPRHMVFDAAGRRAFVIAELTGQVLVFDWQPQQGKLTYRDSVDGLPEDFAGNPSGAALIRHPSGKAIIASQRQHNSIAFFALDEDEKRLPRRVVSIGSGGSEPRDITVDASGRWLFAANQNSDTVTVFELDPQTGLPLGTEPVLVMEIGTPVCVLLQE